jgi:hypothetical protein
MNNFEFIKIDGKNAFAFSFLLSPFSFLLFFFIWGCSIPEEPLESERFDLTVIVLDSSEFTRHESDTFLVAGALVYLSGQQFQLNLQTVTDSSGTAVFKDLLPDIYTLTAQKRISKELAEIITGAPVERVLSGQCNALQMTASDTVPNLWLAPVSLSDLLISEIYYSGAAPNPPNYFHDQFLEIYNNSADTIYLDSLIVADVDFGYAVDSVIHAIHAYMIPGSGRDVPLPPGECLIIAQDAIDHSAINLNSINLTGADFEYYVSTSGDVNNPDVPDMIQIQHKYGVDFLYSVMNDALCILKVKDPYALGYDNHNCLLLPKSAILDAVEYRENLNDTNKRLDNTLDAGKTGGIPMYKGKSVSRKTERIDDGQIILMDNNNSSIDFEILEKPTPKTPGPGLSEE